MGFILCGHFSLFIEQCFRHHLWLFRKVPNENILQYRLVALDGIFPSGHDVHSPVFWNARTNFTKRLPREKSSHIGFRIVSTSCLLSYSFDLLAFVHGRKWGKKSQRCWSAGVSLSTTAHQSGGIYWCEDDCIWTIKELQFAFGLCGLRSLPKRAVRSDYGKQRRRVL